MPGKLRQSAVKSATATSDPEKRYDIPGIDFNEPLSWRAGKAIPVADLLSRLQTLQTELRQYDPDSVDHDAFKSLAQDLANANLLGHKDKGVRALTLVCVVDVLRICAPEAPFTISQLKDMFTVITSSILPALADPSHAYNTQHFYILSQLTEYKIIVLLGDVDRPDDLIIPLVTTCFDIVSGSTKHSGEVEVSKTVELHLSNLLAILIDEVNVPQEVTDIILSQFLRIDARSDPAQAEKKKSAPTQDGRQGTLGLKEYPPAYNMAKFACTTCTDRMLALIGVYFANVIVDASSTIQSNGRSVGQKRPSDSDDSEVDADDLADLTKAHKLIRELWRACPDVLLNVIPQIENELSSPSIALRLLATETLGDLTAGIGIAGLPATNSLDPAAFPLPSVESDEVLQPVNALQAPRSAKPFLSVHSSAYSSFYNRRHDKAPVVRAAWVKAAGRILMTSAGGVSMNDSEQRRLLEAVAQLLADPEEKVRLSAIRSISRFNYRSIVEQLGMIGGLSDDQSVFAVLAERCKDKKQSIRDEAVRLLAQMWGVASGDIEQGNEKVIRLLGDAPSRILGAYYLNTPETHILLDRVLHESLLPISYPPVKVQISRTESQKQRAWSKEHGSQETLAIDPDAIRVRRILTFIRSLDAKARPVFFAMQARQVTLAKAVEALLKAYEHYNGGVVEDDEPAIKSTLGRYIDGFAKQYPDSQKAAADLWKFGKLHDRRNYQLIRFASGTQHDYRTTTKAIKEFSKRISGGPASTQSLLETFTPLLYRTSLLIYNRSHVPAVMDISRTDEGGLAEVANEVLKEISSRNPEVLKTHIQDLCHSLEANAPSAAKAEEASAADALKACAAFARIYPAEVSNERKFLTALSNYALYSTSPRAAKHAVSVLLAVSDKKEMHATDILSKALKGCTFGSPHFLAKLASIAQVCLLAPTAANTQNDAILQITVSDILPHDIVTNSGAEPLRSIEDQVLAKELALKIMVNRCRSEDDALNPSEFDKLAISVYTILMRMINENGVMTPAQHMPENQGHRLKLSAAKLVLKLCRHGRRCEELVTPAMFISIASIVLNPPNEVRVGFVNQLKKYLGQNQLNYRWFTILFLLAFEPNEDLKSSTVTWLKSRAQFYAKQQQQAKMRQKRATFNVMESVFARLLSLLTHHPDYPEKDSNTFEVDLLDFAKYICFYLSAVATEDSLSLIFHLSQRIKQTEDNVSGSDEVSERLYVLSDLAQATIRYWADTMHAQAKGANLLQTWPGKTSLPTSLFKALPNHDLSQKIAERNFLPEDVALGLEKLVRAYVKASKSGHHTFKKATTTERKRRSADSQDLGDDHERSNSAKKAKRSVSLPMRKASAGSTKTPKSKRRPSDVPSSEMPSRKSSRVASSSAVKYTERDSSEDEAEMEQHDRLVSSPVQRGKAIETKTSRSTEGPTEQVREDTPMTDIEINEDNNKENETATEEVDGANDDKAEKQTVSSPLKEMNNGSTRANSNPDTKSKSSSRTDSKSSPATAAPTRKSARTTRSGKT